MFWVGDVLVPSCLRDWTYLVFFGIFVLITVCFGQDLDLVCSLSIYVGLCVVVMVVEWIKRYKLR